MQRTGPRELESAIPGKGLRLLHSNFDPLFQQIEWLVRVSSLKARTSSYRPLLKKFWIEVRTVDLQMALRACLEISLLVVERRCIRRAAETRVRVALKA